MALTTSRARNPPARLPTLPVIEHPISRLANRGDLSVLGSSRNGSAAENKGSLPPLRREKPKKRDRGRQHSRLLTWPFGQERDLDQDSQQSSLQSLAQSRTVDELEELIREKLCTGFYGVKQAFRANDPMGKGNVSREAFTTILYHLCGYVSAGQVSGFLKRVGLDTQTTISYDEFICHFKDTEVAKKEWVDPILRPTREADNTASMPANRLRDEQRAKMARERHEKLKQGKKTPPTFYNALQVFPLLKRKAREGFETMFNILPSSCFDVDGMILKPQLRQALFLLGIHMYDEEFDKVWDRIDRNGLGTVDNRTFFKILGIKGDEDQGSPDKIKNPSPMERFLELPVEPSESLKDLKLKKDENIISDAESDEQKKQEISSEEKNDDVMAVLADKFKEGYHRISEMFTKYDAEDTGTVSKSDFRKVLAAYRLKLGPVEVEHFLSRFGVRDEEMVPYRKILDTYQDRTEKGLLQKVMEDTKHRFNRSRDSETGNTTAVDAEARLLDILHSDFLSLLGAFRKLDRESLGFIKKYQFKELLDARFGVRLTKDQMATILQRLGADASCRLIPYPRFLELFSCVRIQSPKTSPVERVPTAASQRPSTCPTHPPSVQSATSPRALERSATLTELRKGQKSRDVEELLAGMGALLTDKFQVINKTFIGIDKASRNCGNLKRETFRKLFERHDLKLSVSEVDTLWKKLPVERDGTLNFIELVKTCFTAAGKTPPRQEQPEAGLSRVLQNFARTQMRKTLERFVEEEEDQITDIPTEACPSAEENCTAEPREEEPQPKAEKVDKLKIEATMNKIKNDVRSRWNQIRDGSKKADEEETGTVNSEEFKRILRKHCRNVTEAEIDVLCAKFDRKKDNCVSYLEFLKFFLPTMPEGTNPVATIRKLRHERAKTYPSERKTPSREAVATIMYRIRNKMISDWKTLRRAMKKSDLSGDGMVAVSEFRSTMNAFDFPLNEEDYYHIYSAFDVNMDGRISYVEFMKQALD